MSRRIAVVGGGLAGLTVAFRRARAGDRVVLFEPAPRLGGQLWTERRDGFVVEHGAEGFVARSEAVPSLAADLGIGDDLVGQEETRSYGFDGERLVPLAQGEAATFLGFQVPREELGKGIRTFRLGMGQLSDALARAIDGRVDVRLERRVLSVEPAAEAGFRVHLGGGATEEADAVVLATHAAGAASLLEGAFGAAASALRASPTLSSCTVTLAFRREALGHPLDGTGFVVAAAHQDHGFRASTFITSKFAGRSPHGMASVRLFFRPVPEDFALGDDAWVARAEASLRRVFPVTEGPVSAWVSRWPAALPVFDPAHVARVAALEAALGRGVLLAGAAFHGSGIDAAVRSAEAAARALG
jgi:oxygen-dependent protoporphyrinogen oxidase